MVVADLICGSHMAWSWLGWLAMGPTRFERSMIDSLNVPRKIFNFAPRRIHMCFVALVRYVLSKMDPDCSLATWPAYQEPENATYCLSASFLQPRNAHPLLIQPARKLNINFGFSAGN
ncbi:hypothetical protein CRG98_007603 [Punica granatum]|uniref:Uncharacterized protein n=1 Tax=Punica granatum TaxID=22663 RepID=A0A2I0KU24_PUNGR|nr:hypothetical protein CRG98_007603 [Punica granatum]